MVYETWDSTCTSNARLVVMPCIQSVGHLALRVFLKVGAPAPNTRAPYQPTVGVGGKGRVTGLSDHRARCTLREHPPKYRLRSARERAALSESAAGDTRCLRALQNGDFGVAEWASGADFGRKMGLSENVRKG